MIGPSRRAARRAGWVALACSLLGWSTWWVACNVHGFAPRLPTWPLGAAWMLALLLPFLRAPACRLPWALATVNGLYLLALHRGWGLPLPNALLWLAATLLLACRGRGPGAASQAAGQVPAA